jgi:hypothetical protein
MQLCAPIETWNSKTFNDWSRYVLFILAFRKSDFHEHNIYFSYGSYI